VFGEYDDLSAPRKIFYSSVDSHVMFDAKGAAFISYSYVAPPQLSLPIESNKTVLLLGRKGNSTMSVVSDDRRIVHPNTTTTTATPADAGSLVLILTKSSITPSDFDATKEANSENTGTFIIEYNASGGLSSLINRVSSLGAKCGSAADAFNTSIDVITYDKMRVRSSGCRPGALVLTSGAVTSRGSVSKPFYLYVDRACASMDIIMIESLIIIDTPRSDSIFGRFSGDIAYYVSVAAVVPIVYFVVEAYMKKHYVMKRQ
jgi:hypothetical protein